MKKTLMTREAPNAQRASKTLEVACSAFNTLILRTGLIESPSFQLMEPMMRHFALLISLSGAALFLSVFQAHAQLTPQEIQDAQRKQDDSLRDHPFNVYGKALDENGHPVAGATVKILVGGELGSTQGDTEHNLQSGPDGLFSLEGVHGMDLTVTVSKDGYYTLPDKHNGPWFWMEQGFKSGTMPTKDQPAIFPLKRKGATEPLIVVKTNGSVNVPPDGTAVEYNLERRRVVKGEPGTFNVQLWVDAHDPKSTQPYHWKYRITVPGGGLQSTQDEYQFSAPTSGYQEFIENEVTPGVSGWNDSREEMYFVKLADGRYARIRFEVRALGDFFIEDGYLNPSGSQNLEFDPAKRIRPSP